MIMKIIKKILLLFIIFFLSNLLISCSCGKNDIKKVEQVDFNFKKISADRFTSAFKVYLSELNYIESSLKINQLQQIAIDQKKSLQFFKENAPNKSSLLDDPTGKFKELEPLIKENKINEIILKINTIVNENYNDKLVLLEAYRKLAICYYIIGDDIKCSGYMSKYYYQLDEIINKEDLINENALKYIND